MSTFVGIGCGPIQTGIFVAGAWKGGFNRIVIAEVNEKLKTAINDAACITIHIAAKDKVYPETYHNVEAYNPQNPAELEKLIEAAAEASEFATALPSIKFFSSCAPWLREAFTRSPERRRFIYTAENNNHAAEALEEAVGQKFSNTYYLNTVVGKMSGVITPSGELTSLAPGVEIGHLVEEFDKIYISRCPGIEERKTLSLYEKSDLFPFEEAKLYGHNAVHFLLGMLAKSRGCEYMDELVSHIDLMAVARAAFIEESGVALLKKYASFDDELFTNEGFKFYAEDLLIRMTNPFLKDAIARVTRDLERKLGWDDRVIGTMRLVLEQGFTANNFAIGAKLALDEFAEDKNKREMLENLWPKPWTNTHKKLTELII